MEYNLVLQGLECRVLLFGLFFVWSLLRSINSETILYFPIGIILMQTECQSCDIKTGCYPTIVGGTGITLVGLSDKLLHIGILANCFV